MTGVIGLTENTKDLICKWLRLSDGRLNEIQLADVNFSEAARKNIIEAVTHLVCPPDTSDPTTKSRGFWDEETGELIICVRICDQVNAIIIPPGDWLIRQDISIQ
jgi:hypothetical protein